MKKFFVFLMLAAGLALAGPSRAEDLPPDVLVKNVTNEVLEVVKKDREIQNGNTRRVVQLIEAKVLPHFNFTHMTILAVGRDWRQANPAQQKALTDEFKDLLVRTYSNAFTSYKNQTVSFRPMRVQPSDTDVTVRTEVVQPGGQPVKIDYALEKTPAGWKVYDVTVEASSLVMVYRDQFGQQVRSGGIDGLIAFLHSKNQGAESAGKAVKK
ncbi:MAG: ABC transporter substrate-binding protein [Rhodocyclaceae bacterium]|nr:ABC transporter substrate-binding protein [Rhodocyclaceae bacterium]